MSHNCIHGRWILIVAALLGAASLVLSAMSAHAFSSLVDAAGLVRLEKANRYLTHYSLVVLMIGLFYQLKHWRGLVWVALLFSVGVGIFSGSLYILSLTRISGFALATPLGGLTLLAGWLMLAWTVWKQSAVAKNTREETTR